MTPSPCWVVLAACGGAAPPSLGNHAHDHPGCVIDAVSDLDHHPVAVELLRPQADLDGDGTDDTMVRWCPEVNSNCELSLYASNDGCTTFVGNVVYVPGLGPPSPACDDDQLQTRRRSQPRAICPLVTFARVFNGQAHLRSTPEQCAREAIETTTYHCNAGICVDTGWSRLSP